VSTSIVEIRDLLKDNVKFYRQRTPIIYSYNDTEYLKLAKRGIQSLYIDAGWNTWDIDYVDSATPTLNKSLTLIEKEYALVAAEIAFWNQCLSDYNTILSYTTDSLSVTGSGNIGKLISETIQRLNLRQTELFYKLGSSVTSMSEVTSITVTNLDVTYE
jgi:hypothetical protein